MVLTGAFCALTATFFTFGFTTLALLVDRIGLALRRRKNHGHVAAVLARHRFDSGEFSNFLSKTLQESDARFRS